jgi:hypothetical protein
VKLRPLAPSLVVATLAAGIFASLPNDAHGFTHVVRKGETLASIASAVYGRPDWEYILVGANALDAEGGSAIAPGMRLEVPAVGHTRTALGDTWPALADKYLGDPNHARVLAESNGAHPWELPDPGSVIVIPYVLRHFAAEDETIFDLAQRYLGDKMLAWRLVVFNDLKGNDIHRGDVVLVPLDDLKLTPKGEAEAAIDRQIEISGAPRDKQRKIEELLPELNRLVVDARFVEAVALGERLRGMGDATRSQLAKIGKRLTVAYVALDAPGAAADACRLYLDNAHTVHLEPETTSPKIRAACGQK